MTNPSIAITNQSVNNCKIIEDLKCEVLNDNTASSVINQKPKTMRPSKLSERLKVSIPETPSPPISNFNNNRTSAPIPTIFNIPQVKNSIIYVC